MGSGLALRWKADGREKECMERKYWEGRNAKMRKVEDVGDESDLECSCR